MQFNDLIANIEQTHVYFQERAARQIDHFLTLRNWLIGYYIVEFEQNGEERAEYGNKLIISLAKRLKHLKGFSDRSLYAFKLFYQTYPQISQTVSAKFNNSEIQTLLPIKKESLKDKLAVDLLLSKLSFSHFVELLQVDSEQKRGFYEVETIKNNWSVRELARAVNTLLFERTGLSEQKKEVIADNKGKTRITPKDIIRNPYILEFLDLKEDKKYSEKALETEIIDHLQDFLLEMGHGFCFEARQKRVTFDNEHYKIDLVFYHRILKCHVLIDLKVGKFSHADAGQMNFYLNYYKKNEMSSGDNPPIGMILCATKNDAFVEYAIGGLEHDIFVSKYLVELPKIEDLKKLVEKDTQNL